MSELNNFDNHIKSEISDYAPPVPPGTWEKIMAEREKRKPVGFWWNLNKLKSGLLLVAFLICAITGGFLFTQYKKTDIPVTATTPPAATEVNKPNLNPVSNSLTKATHQDIKTENQSAQSDLVTDNNSDKTSNKYPTTSKTVNPLTGSPKTTNASTNHSGSNTKDVNNTGSLQVKANKNNYPITVVAAESKQEKNSSPLHAGKIHRRYKKSSTNSTVLAVAPDSIDSHSAESGNDVVTNDLNNVPTSLSLYQLQLNNKSISAEAINPIPSLSLLASTIKMKEASAVKLPGCPTIEKNTIGNKKYIEFYAGPDFTLRSFSDTPNSNFLTRRKESTQILSAYSAGVRFTKVFNNGLNVRAGLNYSQINEKFTFVQNNLIQVTYIIDPVSGDTTGSYIIRGSRNKVTYNHYRSIDIPLTLGYEFGEGRLHTNISLGAIVNAYSWQKGELLDSNYNPVLITTGKSSSMYQYKTNFGIGLTGSVSLYYKLNDQMYLLAEPYFRYNLSPVNQEQISLKQKYNTVGLRLGLRIDF